MTINLENINRDLLTIIHDASNIALNMYQQHLIKNINHHIKDDNSIVSEADTKVEAFLISKIKQLTPHIPIVSEEDFLVNKIDTSEEHAFWLIDPIDGTKHFWEKKGEFSINIALIQHEKPVLGMINIPTENVTYFAIKDQGCFKIRDQSPPIQIVPSKTKMLKTILTSNITAPKKLAEFKALFPNMTHLTCGSAIKFCRIAEGMAELYPKLASIMEWDTAAGQLILEETGGGIFDLQKKPLTYNKPHFRNPSFFAIQNIKMIEQLDFLGKIEA